MNTTETKMKMSKQLYESIKADFEIVAKASGMLGQPLSMLDAFFILRVISVNRSYDDSHPYFQQGIWTRVLPYDGRPYTFYYNDNGVVLNDGNVETALKKIIKELSAKNFARLKAPNLPQRRTRRNNRLRHQSTE